MRKVVLDYIRQCDVCQRHKDRSPKASMSSPTIAYSYTGMDKHLYGFY